jgi:GNAT superfamily N-acetyltransferase
MRDLNQVILNRAVDDLTAEVLSAAVRRLGREQIDVWDAATAERLRPGLEALGWDAQTFALMAAPEGSQAPAAAVAVVEVEPAELAMLREQWLLERPPFDSDEELLEQVLHGDRLLVAATPTRGFGVRDETGPGEVVSMALLMGGADGTAMIEDVYTTPSRRRQGLGSAVVLAAADAGRAMGCDLVYLPTDAAGPAHDFYRRLGFVSLGTVARFVPS